jgi:ribosomal protein S1
MVGEEVEVVVLCSTATKRVSSGSSRRPGPWTSLGTKYPVGTAVRQGRQLANYGAFVELEEGVGA